MIEYTARITSTDTPRVGGRNLVTRASLSNPTTEDDYGFVFESDKAYSIWLSKSRDYPQAKAGDTVTLSLLIRCDKSEWGASEWVIRVFDSQGPLSYFQPNKEVFGEFYKHTWTFELRDDGRLPNVQLYNHVWRKDENGRTKFNKRVEAKCIKLERGTVATDWTPAPEDLDDRISTVNTSLVSLASQLESHKTDTDKNFEELSDHPLTIDDNGYWRIWNLKQQQYVTTQYQSRGRDGHSPRPEEVLGTPTFRQLLTSEVASSVEPVTDYLAVADKYIDNAFAYIENIAREIDSSRSYTISDSGYISSSVHNSCRSVSKEVTPSSTVCRIPNTQPQIRLTLRSDHDALKRQVDTLTAQLTQLQATTKITPVLNSYTRKQGSTLYPLYGDWLLTSDSEEQYISFSGLSAEVGRSIYIQTRKRVYLYSNGHSFFGLPGTSRSTAVNQWLSNNTTYRFVRADATTWLVTASSSPYPWT